MVQKVEKIWFDGKLINWDDANVHVLTHTLHYGMGIFEGIRFYKCHDGRSAVYRLKEHIDRFCASAKIAKMELPFSNDDIYKACLETTRISKLEEGYIRPYAFIGYGAMGLYVDGNPIHTIIAVWPWGAYLGDEGIKNGIRAKISSYTRHHVNVSMTKAKISGQYTNSILAKKEAKEMVLLTFLGAAKLAKASGKDFKKLVKEVASAKGTTEAALKVFKKKKIDAQIKTAVNAAYQRAKTIAFNLSKGAK